MYRTATDTIRCECCGGSDIHTFACAVQAGVGTATGNACLDCGTVFATPAEVVGHVRTAHA